MTIILACMLVRENGRTVTLCNPVEVVDYIFFTFSGKFNEDCFLFLTHVFVQGIPVTIKTDV